MSDNLEYCIFLNEHDYTWKNALLWGNCINHYKQTSKNNRYAHYIISLIEAPPILGQIISIFETCVALLIIKIYSSLKEKNITLVANNEKIYEDAKKIHTIAKKKFSLETSSEEEIKQEMESIFAIYETGYTPKDSQRRNLGNYVCSPKYREHCQTAKIYYNESQLNVDDAKQIAHQREPVNIEQIHHYDGDKLEKKYGHSYSVYKSLNNKKTDGSPFKSLPNTIAIYSETYLWPNPGGEEIKEIACLSLPSPALDTSDQPHWDYYITNSRLNRDRYEQEMTFLANVIIKAILDNASIAFGGSGIKRVVIPRYGQGAFLKGLQNESDRKFANNVFYYKLFKAISNNHSNLQGIEFRISEYSNSFNKEIQENFLKQFDQRKFLTLEKANDRFQSDVKNDKRVHVGIINGNILDTAQAYDLIINAWDPHSIPGNGCEGDRSFDGAMGKGSGIPVVQLPWLNTFLYNDTVCHGIK